MAGLEDRLRSELRQISYRLDPAAVGPLRAPARRRAPGLVRWLAPVSAMAAVIAGVHLARPPRPHSSSPSTAMPRYYVVLGEDGGDDATVHASATGATLARVPLPATHIPPVFDWVELVSGAADDRTFLIEDVGRLFVLRVAANGRSATVRRLRVTLSRTDSAALSPDGSTAAVESMSSCSASPDAATTDSSVVCSDTEIRLISLATSATLRTWSTHMPAMLGTQISWTRASQILFLWPGRPSAQPPTLRLLNVRAPGSNLLAAQVLRVGATFAPGDPGLNTFITPDGSKVFSSTVSFGVTDTIQVTEYSERTGLPLRVLASYTFAAPQNDYACEVLSIAPAGSHVLINCTTDTVTVFGRVDNGRFTPLPWKTFSEAEASW